MSILDFFTDLLDPNNDEGRAEYSDDPDAYIAEHLPEGVTSADVLAAIPDVCSALPPEQALALRAAYSIPSTPGGSAPPAPAHLPPPPPAPPGETDFEAVVRQVDYITNVYNTTHQTTEDNDTTIVNDQDQIFDNSVNQEITAFGDVNQEFDNDIVSGDGAVAAGDNAQVNTGEGAVQAGGNITDATIATGDVEGSVTGDVEDSIVGDDNQAIIDSEVGAASFGSGDATNVNADNAVLGDGTIVSDIGGGVPSRLAVEPNGGGDANVNTGSGDQFNIENSDVSESAIGGGNVQSNDVDIDVDGDGSGVAFGEGSSVDSSYSDNDINVNGDNTGTLQTAGNDSTQFGETDNSVDASVDVTTQDSFNTDYTDNSQVDQSVEVTDNDFSDVEVDQAGEDIVEDEFFEA